MSAPATKSKVNGTTKPSTANGTSTPSTSTEQPDTSAATGGRPNKAAYDAEQEKLKKDIDAHQVKLSALREKIGLATKGGNGNERRNVLRTELDALRGKQSTNKSSRGKILDELKALHEGVQKKIKDLQAAKAKIPYKNVAEVDARIAQLDKQIESGSMKLADEKRALQEVSQAKRSRRAVEGFQSDQESIEYDRAAADGLKQQLDDPEFKATSDRFDTIKAELDELKKESDEAYNGRSKLFEERDNLQNQINALYNAKRESAQKYKDDNDRYWTKVNEDRTRRNERIRLQKQAEEQEKRRETAERLREEAEAPAYQAEIEDCQTLIDSLTGKTTGTIHLKIAPTKPEVAGVSKLELRTVEAPTEGLVVRKKKNETTEDYFAGSKGKKGKKGNAQKSGTATPTEGSAPPSSQSLNVPLATLAALQLLSIPPPTSSSDVARVVEDLKTKKEWFSANQDRVTAENIAKAEANIKRLDAKEAKQSVSATPSGDAAATPVDSGAATPADSGAATPAEVEEPVKEEEVEAEAAVVEASS